MPTTATAQEAPPVMVNLETGEQVDFIRTYWNANVDIANRRIQCDFFDFNEESAVYEKQYGWEYFHNPLHDGGGAATHDFVGDPRGFFGWGVSDGLYSGQAPLGSPASPFVELMTYSAASNGNQNNAVRSWRSDTSHQVCFDLDGGLLLPTGSAEIGNTGLLPAQTFSIQLPLSGTPVTETPEVVRLDTGEPVEFVRAEFDYIEDLLGRTLSCWFNEWYEEFGRYGRSDKPEGASIVYRFPYAYTGGETVWIQSAPDDFRLESYTANILEFMSHTVRDVSFIEVDDLGYNMWGASQYQFYRCDVSSLEGKPFAPNKILLTPQDTCDYSATDQYDGWGWNAATQQGCPPEENTENSIDDETADQQTPGTDESSEQSDNGEDSAPTDSSSNNTGEQLNNGSGGEGEADEVDDALSSADDGSASTVTTGDQSSNTDSIPAQTSGAGMADKFFLFILLCFLGSKKIDRPVRVAVR